jgi:hypothetical protein
MQRSSKRVNYVFLSLSSCLRKATVVQSSATEHERKCDFVDLQAVTFKVRASKTCSLSIKLDGPYTLCKANYNRLYSAPLCSLQLEILEASIT